MKMSVYSMYFSPTGGTKNVMDILSEELSADTQIDLSVPDADYGTYSFKDEDVCLIGVPSYGGRVPSIVLERIRRMRPNGALAVVIVVFGNRAYDDTLLELKNEVEACGFQVGAAAAAVAEHSIMRQFGAGRPDAEDKNELCRFAKAIGELTTNRKNIKEFKVPGNFPYKEYGGVPFKPKAKNSCTQCGLCAEKCPVQAIPKDNLPSVDEMKCISCMRCVSDCPQQARKLNKAVLFAASQSMKKVCSGRKENELFL